MHKKDQTTILICYALYKNCIIPYLFVNPKLHVQNKAKIATYTRTTTDDKDYQKLLTTANSYGRCRNETVTQHVTRAYER